MQELLDALGTRSGGASFFLDLATGEVVVGAGDEPRAGDADGVDADEARFAPIPRRPWTEDRPVAAALLLVAGEGAVRAGLRAALDAEDGGAAFERLARADPAFGARWEAARREAHLAQALAWLGGLGIEPVYDLPAPGRARRAGGAAESVGLLELVALGAAADEGGRAVRRLRARSAAEAAKIFARAARELRMLHGAAADDEAAAVGAPLGAVAVVVAGVELVLRGETVELALEIPRAAWRAFGAPEEEPG
jgi:hypothetical protein